MRSAWMWVPAVLSVAFPLAAGGQSQFAVAARAGYSGFAGSEFASTGGALLLDLSLRYGRRHGLSASAGGHFSNHTRADSIELDAVGGYLEGRWTGLTVSENVLPFVAARAGYTRHVLTVGSGGSTQSGDQDGWTLGGSVGAALELGDRIDVEIAGVYTVVDVGDATIGGIARPGSGRRGGQWAVLAGVVFRPGG